MSGIGERPPPLVVTAGDARIELQPYTVCWSTATSGYCADGTQPSPLPSLGAIKESLEISWPLAGWDFVASIHQAGEDAIEVELGKRPGVWVIEVDDLEGNFDVSLSGFGPERDVQYQFSVDVEPTG